MTTKCLDPLREQVVRLIGTKPSTTEELRKRLVDQGESVRERRLSRVLHDLHAAGRLIIRRHCNVYRSRLPVRQEWHLAYSE